MGIGVAGKIAITLAGTVLLAGSLAFRAAAQQPANPLFPATNQTAGVASSTAPELFNLSGSCSAPDATVSSLVPLPNLAAILQSRMNVRVLTVGNWVPAGIGGQHRLTDELEQILERAVKGLDLEFTHRGVSGERAATTSERLKQEVALLEPDLVLWQVGTNDALMHVPVSEFEATLSAAVEWLREHNKDVVLVGLQYSTALSKNAHYRAIKDAVGRVAARNNVLLVRRYETVQFIATASREQARLAKDEFMMSELGSKCMAEHIARALVVNVFARRLPSVAAAQLPGSSKGATQILPQPAGVAGAK